MNFKDESKLIIAKSRILTLIFLSLVTLLSSASAYSEGIICSKDNRIVDGNYSEINLSLGDNGYNLTKKIITSGMNGTPETIEESIAVDLKCNIDGIIAYCSKTIESSDSSLNPIFRLKTLLIVNIYSVEKTQLLSHSQNSAETSPKLLEVEISKSNDPKAEKYSYEIDHDYGGCREY